MRPRQQVSHFFAILNKIFNYSNLDSINAQPPQPPVEEPPKKPPRKRTRKPANENGGTRATQKRSRGGNNANNQTVPTSLPNPQMPPNQVNFPPMNPNVS
jgi:hypothetical protein